MKSGSKKHGYGWARAILIGAALAALAGCVYEPAPYGYGGGYGGGYYRGYYGPAYYGRGYYGPEFDIYGGGRRDWR